MFRTPLLNLGDATSAYDNSQPSFGCKRLVLLDFEPRSPVNKYSHINSLNVPTRKICIDRSVGVKGWYVDPLKLAITHLRSWVQYAGWVGFSYEFASVLKDSLRIRGILNNHYSWMNSSVMFKATNKASSKSKHSTIVRSWKGSFVFAKACKGITSAYLVNAAMISSEFSLSKRFMFKKWAILRICFLAFYYLCKLSVNWTNIDSCTPQTSLKSF